MRRNLQCPTVQQTNASLQRKPLRMDPPWGARVPSPVSVCTLSGCHSRNAAIVCHCLPPLYSSNCDLRSCWYPFHLWKSCALVQLRPCLSVTELSYALPQQSARKNLQFFCPAVQLAWNVACETSPVTDALKSLPVPTISPAIDSTCTRFPLCCFH